MLNGDTNHRQRTKFQHDMADADGSQVSQEMSRKTGNLHIVVNGVLIGIGLVAVAMAIFTRLPIGSEFLKVLRRGSEVQSGARIAAPRTHRAAPEKRPESREDVQPEPEPEIPQNRPVAEPEALPSSITITTAIEVSIGIGKIDLEVGNILPVEKKEDDVFFCSYLGDTVNVPISATNWKAPDAP